MRGHGPEHGVQLAILEFLAYKKIMAWRCNSGAAVFESNGRKRFVSFGRKGMSDILGILPGKVGGGRLLAIEVKAPKTGRVTPEQQDFLNDINRHGGCAFVARSVDDVQSWLDVVLA